MADERKEIILKLNVDAGNLKSEMAARTKDINATKEAIKALNFAIAEGGTATQEQEHALLELESTLRNLTKEQTKAKLSLDSYNKEQKAALGSNDQIRARLSLLTIEYNKMSEAEREGTERGRALASEMKHLSDTLKKNESAVGDNRRSVGSYSEAIEKAISGNATFGDGLQQIKDGFEIIKSLAGAVTNSIKGQAVATEAATVATEGQAAATVASSVAMKGAQKSAIGLGVGLKAIGIGLLIAAVAGLISYFSRFESGMEKLEQVTAGLGAAFDVIAGKLGDFGKSIVDAFTSPLESAKRLFEFLKTAVTDPRRAIDMYNNSVQKFNQELVNTAREAMAAAKAMANITAAAQDLEDAQLAALPGIEKQKGQIEQLMLQAKERTKSEKERLAGLKEAGIIETQLTEQRLGFAKEELSLALRREQMDRNTGKLDRTTRSEEAVQAEVKLQQILNESAVQRQQIANRESVFIKEINEERLKAAQEHQEALYRAAKAGLEARVLQAGEQSRKQMEAQIEIIKFERDHALKAEKLSQNEKLLIREKANQELFKLAQDFTKRALEEEKKRIDGILKAHEEEVSLTQAITTNAYDQEQIRLANDYANGLSSREQYNTQLQDLEDRYLNQRLADANALGLSTVEIERQMADRRIAVREREVEETARLEAAKFDLIANTGDAIGELINIVAGQSKAGAEFQKALAIFQIGVDTAKSISQIVTIATAATPDNIFSGGLTIPIKLAALTGVVLANVKKAIDLLTKDAPEPPKFSEGGVLRGRSHAQGGIDLVNRQGKVLANAEEDEIVLTKNVYRTPALRAAASAINVAAGGRPLIHGRYHAQGGVIPSSTRNGLSGSGTDYKQVAQELARAYAALPNPVVSVTELNRVQNQVQVREIKTNS